VSYYMGDFYQGDYYSGDPGLFSFFGKAAKGIGRLIGRASGMQKMLPGPARIGVVAAAGAATSAIVKRGVETVVQHPVLSAAAAAGIIGAGAGTLAGRAMAPGMAGVGARGFHMTRPQRIPRQPAPHLARNRRMRVTNPKALHRAIRRAHGFARLARKVMRFTSPRPPRGRGFFKTRRRKK
jgi:hypothetical protein